MSDLRPGFWLTGRGWLDNDGRHVWAAHDCTNERAATMLPFPTWHVTDGGPTGRQIEPSVSCEGCGFHSFVEIGTPDDAYRCMETFEYDGSWCERMRDHDGAHQSGLIMWGTYARLPEGNTPQ